MFSQDDVPFLTVLLEQETDPIALKHYVQWLAERGEHDTSVWLYRHWGVMRRELKQGWEEIAQIRRYAGVVGEYALQIVDYLLPHFRWPDTKAHATEDVRGLPVAEFAEGEHGER